MGNKMFIIGDSNQSDSDEWGMNPASEVYDKVLQKFSSIALPGIGMMSIQNVVEQPYCIGNKIILVTDWNEKTVNFREYDVDKNSWSTQEKHLI